MEDTHDIIIIGGGPAGLAAGIYAARARMKTLLVEKGMCGGQALVTDVIENFPGFPGGIKGPDLSERMLKQAESCGLKTDTAEATRISFDDKEKGAFTVALSNKEELKSLSLIIATGARWNSLGIPGEKELTGRGVSYCATCDGPLFRGKDVVVVGGGDSALEDALFLTKFANRVTVVHRRDRLRAAKILQERAFSNKRINLCFSSVALDIAGAKKVEGVKIKNVTSGEETVLRCDGVFVLIGLTPNSETVKDILRLDEKGYIVTDDEMRTSASGIFACGDVRKKSLRQVVTATGDGAQAAFSAQHYVERLKGVEYK